MPDPRNSASLTPEQLAQLLHRLEEVMVEAQRLRNEVARQLSDQRRRQQPRVTAIGRRASSRKKRR